MLRTKIARQTITHEKKSSDKKILVAVPNSSTIFSMTNKNTLKSQCIITRKWQIFPYLIKKKRELPGCRAQKCKKGYRQFDLIGKYGNVDVKMEEFEFLEYWKDRKCLNYFEILCTNFGIWLLCIQIIIFI